MSTITQNHVAKTREVNGDGDLPEGWASVLLSEICDINPPKPRADALPSGELVTFVPMPAVNAEAGAITRSETRPFSKVREAFTAFQDGDVIFAKITPCMENGKAAVARNLLNGFGFGSTEFHVIRSNGAVLPEYVYHFVRQESFRKSAEAEMTGSVGQKRVPSSFVKQTELPLAPLAEQKRIVAKIEELFTENNAARARLAKASQILKRFRQAVLAAACSGRLTEELRVERRLPDWEYASLENAGVRIQIGPFGSLLHRHDYVEGGIPLINPMHIKSGEIFPSADFAVPSDKARELAQYRLRGGDVILGRRGEMGRAAVVREAADGYLCGTGSLFVRPIDGEIDSHFLCFFLQSPQTKSNLEMNAVGSTMVNLNQRIVGELEFPKADIHEQHEIVRRVEALFKLADSIENGVEKATKRADKLPQAILAKAFRGELVPTEAELARREGRDFEPASELLARIKTERESRSRGKRVGNRKPRRSKS